MHLVKGPSLRCHFEEQCQCYRQSRSPVTQPHPLPQHHHAQRTNTPTLQGHLDSSHSGSTAKFIITLVSTKKTHMHSQHHLVQAQALGLISKIKQISLMIVSPRACSDMPKSWVHSYYSHRITMRECHLGSSQGRKGITQEYTMQGSLCKMTRTTGPFPLQLQLPSRQVNPQ